MGAEKSFENYPFWIVVVSNLLSASIYLTGAFIMLQVGLIWLALYLLYILVLEIRLLKKSCVNCHYFGKTCAFGKGRLSRLLFRKGSAEKFAGQQITWKDIIPDFMVTLMPMLAATTLLIKDWNLTMIVPLAAIFLLGFPCSGLVRSKLACKHCKQRELGCPAEQLFKTKKS